MFSLGECRAGGKCRAARRCTEGKGKGVVGYREGAGQGGAGQREGAGQGGARAGEGRDGKLRRRELVQVNREQLSYFLQPILI